MVINRPVLNMKEACEYIGYAKSYVYKLVHWGILRPTKPNGGKIFFKKTDLDNWLLGDGSDKASSIEKNAAMYCVTH